MSKLEVIHENKGYIVINKVAGLISEQSPFEELTVESQVQKHLYLKNSTPTTMKQMTGRALCALTL